MGILRHGNLLPSAVVFVFLLFLLRSECQQYFTIDGSKVKPKHGTEYDVSLLSPRETLQFKLAEQLDIKKIKSPNPWHSCYKVSCKNESSLFCSNGVDSVKFCTPALAVAGFGKCGTSAMSAFVTGVPGSHRISEGDHAAICNKEGCKSTDFLQNMWTHYTLPMEAVSPDGLLYNGDINMKRHVIMQTIFDRPKQYFILMVRDFAEMMWSRYNYFCFNVLDGPCDKVNMTTRKRSPEEFHELIVSQGSVNRQIGPDGKFRGTGATLGCPPDSKGDYSFYKEDKHNLLGIEGFKKLVGEDRVFVFVDKQLETAPEYIYAKLSEKISFFKDNYNATYVDGFKKVRVNLNDVRATGGDAKGTVQAPVSSGTYSISGHKPMLPETRELLNRCWQDECKYLSELTGYQFPACA